MIKYIIKKNLLIIMIFSLIFGVSCSGIKLRSEYGIGNPIIIGRLIEDGSGGDTIKFHSINLKLGQELYKFNDSFSLDGYGGYTLVLPYDKTSTDLHGFFLTPTVLYNGWDFGKPYVGVDLGMNWQAGDKWIHDSTRMNFMINGSLGLIFNLSEHLNPYIEYKFWHISNGGITEKNPGWNSDIIIVGFEYKI